MIYLGDSVYAEFENGIVKLTTRNGLPTDPSNTIYLEPEVFGNLFRFIEASTKGGETTEA